MLEAPGEAFATWVAHAEVGGRGAAEITLIPAHFTPALDGWATVDGTPLGVRNNDYGLGA